MESQSTSTNLLKVKEIFLEAIENQSAATWGQFLTEKCGGDQKLRGQVEELLDAHRQENGRFDEPIVRVAHEPTPNNDAPKSDPPRPELAQAPLGGVLGDFSLIREIGRGGMGVVYEAQQASLKRRVALKVLPFAAVLDQRQLKRFQTEAEAAASLHHGHIVPVYQVGCDRAVHFYAMEYIDGQNVAELIHQLRQIAEMDEIEPPATVDADFELASGLASGRFEPPDRTQSTTLESAGGHSDETSVSVQIRPDNPTRPLGTLTTKESLRQPEYFRTIANLGIQAAEALEFAHQHGVLHRDIKPSNLMLDAQGKLWITDFGLARVEGDIGLTMTGDIMGTLRYMSPEQAIGRTADIDARSDVYSLGVTLYEMLSLTPIFPMANRHELLQMRQTEEPVSLGQVNKEVPADLKTIVHKAMAREPEDRYATAQELSEDLQRYLNNEPILAIRPSTLRRALKWSQRHKSLVASLMILAVGGSLAGYGVSRVVSDPGQPVQPTPPPRIAKPLPAAVPAIPSSPASGKYLPGLISEPTFLPGIGRWQIITKQPRSVLKSGVWSPDEKMIALGEAGHVRIYDASSLILLNVLVGHSQHVTSVAWHPQGDRLASASWDGTVRLWTIDGVPTHTLTKHTGPVYQVAWHPSGEQLASCGADGSVRLWNADGTEAKVLNGHRNHVFCLDYSPKGGLLASGGGEIGPPDENGDAGDTTIRVWNIAGGNLLNEFTGHKHSVLAVDWHPDGLQLAASEGNVYRSHYNMVNQGAVRIWNLDGKAERLLPGKYNSIYTLAWSPNGEKLVFGGRMGNKNVWLWKASENRVKSIFTGIGIDLFSIVWDSGGTELLMTSRGFLRLGKPDGTMAMTLERHPAKTRGFLYVEWSADGKHISSAGKLWQADGTPVELPADLNHDENRWISTVHRNTDWHPTDGRLVRSRNGGIEVVRANGRVEWTSPAIKGSVHNLRTAVWSPDGELIASASWSDMSVRIWSENGELLATLKGHRGGVESVDWSPDGKWLVSGGGDSVIIWTREGQLVRKITGHEDEVYPVKWSPDGQWIASASTDATVRLWKFDGTPGPVLRGHHGGIHDIAWSPDSQRIVSGSWLDSTMRVWNLKTEKTEWQVLQLNEAEMMTLSPSGQPLHMQRSGSEQDLQYLVEKPRGAIEVLTYADFHQRYAKKIIKHYAGQVNHSTANGDWDDAEAAFDHALKFRDQRDPAIRDQVAEIGYQLAIALSRVKKDEQALPIINTSIEIRKTIVEDDPEDADKRNELAVDYARLSYTLRGSGQLPQAVEAMGKAVKITQDILSKNPAHKLFHNNLHYCLRERAYFHAELQQYAWAVADIVRAIELSPEDAHCWYRLALIHLAAGDTTTFRNTVDEMFTRFGETNNVETAHWPIWTSILAAETVDDPTISIQLAERSLQSDPKSVFQQQALGAALYRAGQYEEALAHLTDLTAHWNSEGVTGAERTTPAYSYFFLAMTHHRLGHADEAQHWFEKGSQWIEQDEKNSPYWNRRFTLKLFHKEAEMLLKGSVPQTNKEGSKVLQEREEANRRKKNHTRRTAL